MVFDVSQGLGHFPLALKFELSLCWHVSVHCLPLTLCNYTPVVTLHYNDISLKSLEKITHICTHTSVHTCLRGVLRRHSLLSTRPLGYGLTVTGFRCTVTAQCLHPVCQCCPLCFICLVSFSVSLTYAPSPALNASIYRFKHLSLLAIVVFVSFPSLALYLGAVASSHRPWGWKHPKGKTIYDHRRLNLLRGMHIFLFLSCSLCLLRRNGGMGLCFRSWGDNMVFSLCYRLISLEDQTTNSEGSKPH